VPPHANAGEDITIEEGGSVLLDGSDSMDNVGIVSYRWSFEYIGTIEILLGQQVNHQFNRPGIYLITLTVSDAYGNVDTDITLVDVLDTIRPTAHAGPDQHVDQFSIAHFDGSESFDTSEIINYTWTVNFGMGDLHFYGPVIEVLCDVAGSFAVNLKVTDAASHIGEDSLILIVRDKEPPVAKCPIEIVVEQGSRITLEGVGSTDNIGIVLFRWTFDYNGQPIVLEGPEVDYSFDLAGTFIVTLNVFDIEDNSANCSMTLVVRDSQTPIANAGPDQHVDQGDEVAFNASQSFDNVAIIKYSWSFFYHDTITLHGLEQTYFFDDPGSYKVVLSVEDSAGNIQEDSLMLTVHDSEPPIASAGIDYTIVTGESIDLFGNGSLDNVGIVSWLWTFTYGGEIINLEGPIQKFTFNESGTYHITLTATDEEGNYDKDTVEIKVSDANANPPTSPSSILIIIALFSVVSLGLFVIIRLRSKNPEY
jgi:PKD repeat protein